MTIPEPVALAALAASHREALVAWCRQDLGQWVAGLSGDDPARWIERMASDPDACARVFVDASGAAVGIGGLSLRDRSASIWFWVDPRRRERGVATSAIAAMTRFGFAAHALRAIDAQVAPHNAGSRRVLERCGFRHRLTAASGVLYYRLERPR